LRLGTEKSGEWLRFEDTRALRMVWSKNIRCIEADLYEPCVGVRGIVEELHGKLVASQKHRVRVMLLHLQVRSEVI